MAADRLLATNLEAAPASAEIRAERKRVMNALGLVINDCLDQWKTINHGLAEALIKSFALELTILSQFVRKGISVEAFAKEREPKEATEIT